MAGKETRIAACAEISQAMRGIGRSMFEHTVESFGGGITYGLWLREQGAMLLTVASPKGVSYYDVRERTDPPKKRERVKL